MHRRHFLRSMGVALGLPCLESLAPSRLLAAEVAAGGPKRLVTICTSLGIHAPFLFPKEEGAAYTSTPYLELLKEHRERFTLFSGLSHPDQSGADGHSGEMTWLTSARNPGLGTFRNTVSFDQVLAEKLRTATRFSSMQLGTSNTSQSYSRAGVMLPADSSPSRVFTKLFLSGGKEEIARKQRQLQQGRSILDSLLGDSKRLSQRVTAADKERLDEYFTSVREMEQQLAAAEEWERRPKPQVDSTLPQDIKEERDLIGRMRLLFQMIPLALQTDSTRIISVLVQGRNDVPLVDGVSVDHHNLSHHGQDEAKIAQLRRVEEAQLKTVNELLTSLTNKTDGTGAKLLDSTQILFGSNLGNANSHDAKNLPIILAGGNWKHGQHVVHDAKNNTPLGNLFVQMLQQAGLETDSFGSSTSTSVRGLVK